MAATTSYAPDPGGWARRLIAAAGDQPLPLYDSAEWRALPDNDPRKVASCVRAAETSAYERRPDVIARQLQAELDLLADMDADEANLDAAGWAPTLTRQERQSYARRRATVSELSERRGEYARAERARDREHALGLSRPPVNRAGAA